MRTGDCVYARASSPTSPSSVAEKNIVWRSRGDRCTIRSTCGLKPMSSIRSASSRTRIATASSVTHAPVDRGPAAGPGVATSTCASRGGLRLRAERRRRRRRTRPRGRAAAPSGRAPRSPGRRARGSARGRARRGGPSSGPSALDDRDRERERLAGAGRRLGEHVAAARAPPGWRASGSGTGLAMPRAASTSDDVRAHAERGKGDLHRYVDSLIRFENRPRTYDPESEH